MGRSSKLQAGANRALIVEKASELFRARGIAEVSVLDIMQAAGMTSGGFYKHFASKEALAAEAARLAFDQSRQHWDSIASDCTQGVNALLTSFLNAVGA
ncbi:MAG: TetR/AcrR family transcriptional regulator [Sodalis sp. (in: enterobacteria)]|uniref:TetR/AcrR family transcriptional regulator n=1 Tax=Sodalis sp. (in: enterobacteria) TaxID=1898979 RepID=UPI0039E5CBDB